MSDLSFRTSLVQHISRNLKLEIFVLSRNFCHVCFVRICFRNNLATSQTQVGGQHFVRVRTTDHSFKSCQFFSISHAIHLLSVLGNCDLVPTLSLRIVTSFGNDLNVAKSAGFVISLVSVNSGISGNTRSTLNDLNCLSLVSKSRNVILARENGILTNVRITSVTLRSFNLSTLLVEESNGFLGSDTDNASNSVFLGVNVHTSNSADISCTSERFNVLQIQSKSFTKSRNISRAYEAEEVHSLDILKVKHRLSVSESVKTECGNDNDLSCLVELCEHICVYSVEHIRTHVTNANRNEHRVCHFLFIEILKSVLSKQNFIFLLSVGNLNALSVTVTHSELLSSVCRTIAIDLSLHSGSADKRIIDCTELL
nr:MAG TPA: hypothetical protein [Caudoviricetes sp.]